MSSRHELLRQGLSAPICLTWELTYACNLRCVHCLSSSGRPAPDELTTAEATRLIDEWAAMQVFYINVGGGEPMVRPDFFRLMEYAIERRIGVKCSTNGIRLDKARAAQLAGTDYVDVQISLDGATAEVNDAVRGSGSFATAIRALEHLAEAGMKGIKISVVVTRENVGQLDQFAALTDRYGAQLRLTRLRPSGVGVPAGTPHGNQGDDEQRSPGQLRPHRAGRRRHDGDDPRSACGTVAARASSSARRGRRSSPASGDSSQMRAPCAGVGRAGTEGIPSSVGCPRSGPLCE